MNDNKYHGWTNYATLNTVLKVNSMKLHYFTDDSPTNYCADDNMKHLYFKDYKHLKNVTWVDDSESPITKVLTGIAFVITLITLLFIATI